MDKVYLQLYSLGEAMKDLKVAFEKLGAMGYAGVEFAGSYYGGMNAREIAGLLEKNGLEALSAHVMPEKVEADVGLLKDLGAKTLVCPMMHIPDRETAIGIAKQLNKAGEICAKAGLRYGYHNHTQEFLRDGDGYLLDVLMENTDPELVFFQLDVGWATTAGVDAVRYIGEHAGRILLVHVKEAQKEMGQLPTFDPSKVRRDEKGNPVMDQEMTARMGELKRNNCAMGKGCVDWKAVKAAADAQGAIAYIVEREWDYAGDIFKCVEEDLAYLRGI